MMKDRVRTQCPRGHEMTADNVYINKNDGTRRCRECRRINWTNYALRQNINREWKRNNTRAKPASERIYRAAADTTTSRPPSELIEDAKRRLLAPRSITSALMGDPPAGSSALDRRQNAC
jgi:hypothetical protein